MLRIVTTATLLVLAGCAGGMDREACLAADWQAIGYEDGDRGKAASSFSRHREACARHGVTADFAAYRQGHDEGIARFCRPENGYRLGRRGYDYGGVCPAHLESDFVAAHADGFELHALEASVEKISQKLDRHRARINEIDRLLTDLTVRLATADTDLGERAQLGVDIKELAVERGETEVAIRALEADYEWARDEYHRAIAEQ